MNTINGDSARNAVRVWMRQVMAERQWSAAHWAKLANTTPTNITRFLSPGCRIVPSSDTISKLAQAAGSQPNLGFVPGAARVAVRVVPVVREGYLIMRDAVSHGTNETVAVASSASDQAVAVLVESDSMNASGIFPDDIIVIEPLEVQPVSKGRIVAAVHEGAVVYAEYQPPVLIPRSTNRNHRVVGLNDAEVVGVATQVIRRL
jgi:SOS-response transcriptional repressor LexA